jgi:uncharacterized membrane protein
MTRWLIVSLAMTVLAFGAAVALGWGWPGVFQERIPTHWDINMQPNDWVSREHVGLYLLLCPGVMALLVVMTRRLSPLSMRAARSGHG